MTDETLKPLGDFISQVGFPVFVAIVLMWQFWKMHRENTAAMAKLTLALDNLTQLVKVLTGRKPKPEKATG